MTKDQKHYQKNREKRKEQAQKYRQENREKVFEQARKYRQEDPEKLKKRKEKYRSENAEKIAYSKLKYIYGIDKDDVEKLIQLQKNSCAICEVSFLEKKWRVDHCHTTGKVRQLLCHGCNIGLGHVEKPGFLDKALAYIQRHKDEHGV